MALGAPELVDSHSVKSDRIAQRAEYRVLVRRDHALGVRGLRLVQRDLAAREEHDKALQEHAAVGAVPHASAARQCWVREQVDDPRLGRSIRLVAGHVQPGGFCDAEGRREAALAQGICRRCMLLNWMMWYSSDLSMFWLAVETCYLICAPLSSRNWKMGLLSVCPSVTVTLRSDSIKARNALFTYAEPQLLMATPCWMGNSLLDEHLGNIVVAVTTGMDERRGCFPG
ncbi:hypothetical protein F5B20DRAFT_523535 [Whalleya microplaca]|nr:hypothetical protein F5B20DRAFT_523535 [Whalleya microplaca]